MLLGVCSSLSISPAENAIYLINTVNGFRYILEFVALCEGLKLSKAGESALRRVAKDALTAFYTSFLGASTSAYIVYRYLLKKRRTWVKTEHK